MACEPSAGDTNVAAVRGRGYAAAASTAVNPLLALPNSSVIKPLVQK